MKKLFCAITFTLLVYSSYAQLPSYVPQNSLEGWWPFTNTANDSSGNARHGVTYSVTPTTDRFGRVNHAYHFNGTSSKVEVPFSFFNINWKAFTISCWMYSDSINNPTSLNGGRPILNTDRHNGLAIMNYDPNNPFTNNWDNKYVVLAGTNPNAGSWDIIGIPRGHTKQNVVIQQWNHVVVSKQDSLYTICINGQFDTSYVGLKTPLTSLTKLVFGAYEKTIPTQDHFAGKLDDFGIWSRALSKSEVENLYLGCSTPELSINSNNACKDDTVTFAISSNSNIDSTRIYFGDASSSLVTDSLNHIYTSIGTFYVQAYVYTDCGVDTLLDTINVASSPNPIVTLSGPSPFCKGDEALGSNYSYGIQWLLNGVPVPGANTQAYYPDTSGSYTLMITDTNGCVGYSSAEQVTVFPIPSGDILLDEADSICVGASITLTSPPYSSYSWSTGDTSQNISVSPFFTTVYTVTVTDNNGCVGTLTQSIKVNPVPSVPIISQNGTVLTSSSSSNNQWKRNGLIIGGATAITYSVTSTGYYSVVVTNQYNCSAESDTIEVSFVGLNELNMISSMQLFPNPVGSNLQLLISPNEAMSGQLIIRNMLGQELIKEHTLLANGENFITINVSKLPPGTYLFEVANSTQVIGKKIFTKE